MKKVYSKPMIQVDDLLIDNLLNTVSGPTDSQPDNDDPNNQFAKPSIWE